MRLKKNFGALAVLICAVWLFLIAAGFAENLYSGVLYINGERGAEEMKPVLLDILEDTEDSDKVRLAALDTLGELENIENVELLPVLYEILENADETDEIRLKMLHMLGSLYNTAQDKVSILLNVIEDPEDSEQVRLEALELLNTMDFAIDRISPALLEVVKDVEDTEEVPVEIVRFLQRKEQEEVLEESLPALGEALEQPADRGVAITLLSEIGSDDALALLENVVDDLVGELGDEDPAVRRRAVQQLVEVGSAAEHVVPEIQASLEEVREDLDNATIIALRDINIPAFDEIVEDTIKTIEHERVIRAAELYLIEPVVTITAFEAERSEGGRHDFYSEGDYWWPDPRREDGLPYTHRDGQSNPGNFKKHRYLMRRMSLHVPTLTAAYLLTDDQRYADHAVAHLEAWFVEEETRMNPNLRYGQAIPGRTSGRSIGIIDTLHLAEVARAAKVLRDQQTFPAETLEGVEDWFEDYLKWLTTSSMGRRERDHGNNHSTAWLLQATAFADFLEDEAMLEECRDRVRDIIIPRQMDADGSFPSEINRTRPYGYSLFNWDMIGVLHQILSTPEENLWHFETDDGHGLELANDFIVPYIDDKDSWPHDLDIEYHEDWPMRHPTLLFAGMAYDRPELIELWEELPADSSVHEVVRIFTIRQPLLWMDWDEPDSR